MQQFFLRFPFLIFIFLACEAQIEETLVIEKPKSVYDIYLLIGQSNMAGRGEIELQDKDTLDNVVLFKGDANQMWEKAANPLNKYSTVRKDLSMQKLGPGYTFARKIAEANPERKIALVVNARGGTSLSEWMPGENLYSEAVKRVKAAGVYGVIKGIVWHQGESDVSKSDTYLDNVSIIITSLRRDLGNTALPFVAGQLAPENAQRIEFNSMILQLPVRMPMTSVVTTEGLTTFDGTHFNSASQRILGERYALEMLKITQ